MKPEYYCYNARKCGIIQHLKGFTFNKRLYKYIKDTSNLIFGPQKAFVITSL